MPATLTPLKLVIDLSSDTGALKYGASGFLYGLGNAGIPSTNMLAPIKPQVAAQKPEGGLQHPNGDALNISDTYQAAGGREIEIYLQDSYPHWPYDNLGLDDYLTKFAWDVYRTTVIDVELHAGDNTIKFSNSSSYAPNIDKIEIAARF